MKFPRQFCAATVLTVALAISALADGDTIHTGHTSTVQPPDTESVNGNSNGEAAFLDPSMQVLKSAIQGVLSLL